MDNLNPESKSGLVGDASPWCQWYVPSHTTCPSQYDEARQDFTMMPMASSEEDSSGSLSNKLLGTRSVAAEAERGTRCLVVEIV
mmetsp:Transcript_11342/g.20996  ORF Transcript_11342/g.20996 Transcript_11342/m.20996 type:complete len:84 (+) Transcript_11342:66-317(+)